MPRRWWRLYGPSGADEANFNEHSFKIHDDGSFYVLAEAVDGLTRVGGFTLAPESEQPPEGWEPLPQRHH